VSFEDFLRQERDRRGPLQAPPLGQAVEAPAPTAPPSFEAFLRQVKGERDSVDLTQAQATTQANAQQSAATAASAAPVARELGVPQSAVETDLPLYQQKALAQRNAKVLDSNPIVARWVAANPDSARIAQDEYEQLGAVEKLWQGTKGIGYAALQGLGGSYNSAALGLNRAIQPWARLVAGDKAGDWWGHAMIEPRAAAKQAFELTGEAGVGQKASQMVGQLLGLLSQVTLTGGTGQAPAASAGAVQTIKEGTQTAARAMAFPSLTEAENRAAEVFEKTGDANAAYRAAASTYLFTTLQGLVPFSAPGTVVQRLGTGAVAGAVTSEAQRGLNNVLMPAELQQQFDPQEALFQAITGAALGGVFGPRVQPNLHFAVRQTYTEALRAEQAMTGIERIQTLGEMTKDSKLKSADPKAFRDFVEQVAEGSDLDAVYVDPKALSDALKQSAVLDVPEISRQLEDAKTTGADVRIPVADYAAHIAGTPLEAALLPKLKATPDGMTFEEGQAHFKEAKDSLKSIVEKAAEAQEASIERQTLREEVVADVTAQLAKANRFTEPVNKAYADFIGHFYQTLADRTGESVLDVHAKYPLQVSAEAPRSKRTQALVDARKRTSALSSLLECMK
jgi:hypothetical protein